MYIYIYIYIYAYIHIYIYMSSEIMCGQVVRVINRIANQNSDAIRSTMKEVPAMNLL